MQRLRASVLAAVTAAASVWVSQLHGPVALDVSAGTIGVLAGLAAYCGAEQPFKKNMKGLHCGH